MEPDEFRQKVDAVRMAEKALGRVSYGPTEKEKASRVFRRSLFVVKDMQAGEVFTEENVRSIRPGYGLHTRYMDEVLGRKATRNIERGTPLSLECGESAGIVFRLCILATYSPGTSDNPYNVDDDG